MGYKVVALSSSGAKRELALQLGAHEYLDGSKVNQVEALQAMGGAKVVLCNVAKAQMAFDLIPALAVEGQLVLLALTADSGTFNPGTQTISCYICTNLTAHPPQCFWSPRDRW